MTDQNLPGVLSGGNSKTVYWGIYDGKLSRKSNEGEAGAIARTNKNNVKVWEVHERGVKGILKDVNIFENTFDGKKVKQLVIKLMPADGFT